MTGPTVAVIGATGTGLVYHLDRMPDDGETVLTDHLEVVPGGKASNHALGVARLGGRAVLFSALGDDAFARDTRAAWHAEGIDATAVVTLPDVPSLAGSVFVDRAGHNRIAVATGAMARYAPEHIDRYADALTAATVLVASLEMPTAPALHALRLARDAGVTTVLNPAPAPSRGDVHELIRYADWVTPNEGEARTMTGLDAPDEAAASLRDQGAGNVVVTLGALGALLVTEDGTQHVPATPVPVHDTSGAGDAFNAAFALSLARRLSPVDAVRNGCRAAGRIVQGPNFYSSLSLLDDFSW